MAELHKRIIFSPFTSGQIHSLQWSRQKLKSHSSSQKTNATILILSKLPKQGNKVFSASCQMELEHPVNNHEILVSLNQNLILVLQRGNIICESVMQTPHH